MKKKWIAILCTMALILSACGEKTPAETSKKKDAPGSSETSVKVSEKTSSSGGKVFGFTSMDNSNPFFVTIEKTIREKVEANGDKLVSVDPANDVSRQITQIEDLISQHIDGIFLNPAEAEGIIPALDQLKAAGIPIINYDTEVADLSYVASYVGSDNYNAGKVVGEDLVKKHPEGGKIIILDSPTMNSVVDRVNGFKDAIEGKGFEIVAQQDAKGNLEVAMGIAEDLFQVHTDVIAAFGGNDPTALGILAAANAAGLNNVKIYGVDGSPDFKKVLSDEKSLLEGSGAQSPIQIAEKSVEVMYKVLNGESVKDRYPVDTFMITRDNLAEYGTDGWQ
ncbi:MAG: sugar ABC transporter substrate-binding protein [Peptoniphilaceae bacterium]|nr:sugar ABC transporter substrate-binding protein [Peptoniphilaceae bacterium]